MRAGLLRHRVVVQSATTSTDGFGQVVPTWATVGTYWANVKPLAGKEAERARQIRADVTHEVEMRIPTTITPVMRLQYDSRVLNIVQAINVDERDRTYRILCAEIVSGGTP